MTMQENYMRRLQAQLDQWSADVNELRIKARLAGDEVAWKIEREAADLKWRISMAQEKLDMLKTRGEHALGDLQSGLDRNWNSLNMSMKSASSRFD